MPSSLDLIKSSPLFASLGDEFVNHIAEKAAAIQLAPEDILMAEHSDGEDIFLIIEGEARIEVLLRESDSPPSLIEISNGDFVGQIRFFGTSPPSGTVTATTDIKALKWNASDWRSICESDPENGIKLAMSVGKMVIDRLNTLGFQALVDVQWGLGL